MVRRNVIAAYTSNNWNPYNSSQPVPTKTSWISSLVNPMNLPPFRLMALTNECHGNNKTTGPIYGKDEHHHDLILLDTQNDNNSNTKKNASAKAEASGAIGLLGFLCHYDAANLPTDLSDPVAAFNDSTCFTLDDIEVYSAVPVTFCVHDVSFRSPLTFGLKLKLVTPESTLVINGTSLFPSPLPPLHGSHG